MFLFSKISFGGVSGPLALRTLSKKNFQGCMENVLYNDVNIVNLAQEGHHVSITVSRLPASKETFSQTQTRGC